MSGIFLSLRAGVAAGAVFVSYPSCILVGNRKAPSGPFRVPDGPGWDHVERTNPGWGYGGTRFGAEAAAVGGGSQYGESTRPGGLLFTASGPPRAVKSDRGHGQ